MQQAAYVLHVMSTKYWHREISQHIGNVPSLNSCENNALTKLGLEIYIINIVKNCLKSALIQDFPNELNQSPHGETSTKISKIIKLF